MTQMRKRHLVARNELQFLTVRAGLFPELNLTTPPKMDAEYKLKCATVEIIQLRVAVRCGCV